MHTHMHTQTRISDKQSAHRYYTHTIHRTLSLTACVPHTTDYHHTETRALTGAIRAPAKETNARRVRCERNLTTRKIVLNAACVCVCVSAMCVCESLTDAFARHTICMCVCVSASVPHLLQRNLEEPKCPAHKHTQPTHKIEERHSLTNG